MFYEKAVNNFLNSEQRIIYTEKRVNKFLNNAEHKIIFCRMLEIIYAENNEQFLWENSEKFMWWTENNLCRKESEQFLNNS